MSKHDDKKKGFDFNVQDLIEEQKELAKKIEKAKIPCSHTNANGKIKVRFLDGGTKVQCKKCHEIFDFGTISLDELKRAVNIVVNAGNQIKALSDSPDEERKYIKAIGETIYNVKNIVDVYESVTGKMGKNNKKNKKKNRDYDAFGQYGAGSIRFIK